MGALKTFLDERRTKGKDFTHTGLSSPLTGKYKIDDGELEEFHKLYTAAEQGGFPLSLTERHKDFSPLVVDLDLKFEQDVGLQRQVSEKLVDSFYKIYRKVLELYFGESIPDDAYDAYIFMKPEPILANGNIKDGVHIMFPEIVIPTTLQLRIRKTVVEWCTKAKMFEKIGCKNTVEDIVDESVVQRNNWLMYKSSKTGDDNHAYELERRIGWEDNDIIIRSMDIENPVHYFSIRRHEAPIEYELDDLEIEEPDFKYASDGMSDVEIAKSLVALLSKQRAEHYQTWIELGFCLHNTHVSLLSVWDEFSRSSAKYEEGCCEKLWKSWEVRQDGLTLGSLHRWAKCDNLEGYKKFMREHSSNEMSNVLSLNGTDYHIAVLLYSQYKYDFVFGNNKWYKFKNHRYVLMDPILKELKDIISLDIFEQFTMLGQSQKRKLIETEDENEKKQIETNLKNIENLRKICGNSQKKRAIVDECKTVFLSPRTAEKMDTQTHLLGFENGVYDLNAQRFRDGRPDDCVTFSTGIEYIEYNPSRPMNDVYFNEVFDFLKKVFVDDDIREYVLLLLGSFLHGDNLNQNFFIWTGSGSNGKSTIVDFIENTLGDYVCPLPNTLLTHKRTTTGVATPEMATTKGRRFAHMQEPETGDKIYVGHMKELTGGDKITCRGLYEGTSTFVPQFSLVLCCNELPEIPSSDGGTWRRIRPIEFKSKFVDQIIPEEDDGYHFKKDASIMRKIKSVEWRQAFAGILVYYYKKYRQQGIKEPDSVMKHCREYEKSSNVVLEFMDECIAANEVGGKTKLTDVYQRFKKWFADNRQSGRAPNRNHMKDEIEKRYGAYDNNKGWTTLRIIDDE